MKGAQALFRFLIDAQAKGEKTALVTITAVIGSSSRAPGTHMAVSETGAFLGSFSGGCVEAAVVGEAKRVMAGGQAEVVRFGQGSPYLDIRLPCGGGLDILFAPDPPAALLRSCCDALTARTSIILTCDRGGRFCAREADADDATGWQNDMFVTRHDPEMRLVIIGHGAETEALADLGLSFGAEICVLSPDAELVARLCERGANAHRLKTAARSVLLRSDRHTAIVMLFHDHEWEIALLAQALDLDAFFIGVMGSRATHRQRTDLLLDAGITPVAVGRITAPIGLIPAARDPQTLALSTLSQIVAHHADMVKAQTGSPFSVGQPADSRTGVTAAGLHAAMREKHSSLHQVFGA